MASSSNTDEIKIEVNKLLEDWVENRRKDDYNPVQCLTKYGDFSTLLKKLIDLINSKT